MPGIKILLAVIVDLDVAEEQDRGWGSAAGRPETAFSSIRSTGASAA